MIELRIDEETKTVQFKGPVNFEKAQVVMQRLIDGFGWSRQDAKMDVVGCGPTVEPGMPVPIPGGNPIFYNHPVTGHPCTGDPIILTPGSSLTVSNGGASDGINMTTTTADAPNLTYTVPILNQPLWEGDPRV